MKTTPALRLIKRAAPLLLLSTLNAQLSTIFAQSTAFTYQGRLTDTGAPANGAVELQCTLWNAPSGGAQVASATPATTVVTATNGLFTVPLDFGTAAFDGSDRYLQIEARTSIGPFTLLTPRQKITATPYALLAGKLSGPLPSGSLTGTYGDALTFSNAANVFIGNGAGLTTLNASQLSGAIPTTALSNAWKIGGNEGTTPGTHFLGTTDTNALELKVNGVRALRIEYATNLYGYSPNIVGGFSGNIIGVGFVGAVIGGGGHSTFPNRVDDYFATVVGGRGNTASGFASTAMGDSTAASSSYSTAMGYSTTASGFASTAMGHTTTASGNYSTAMGESTTASGHNSTAMGVSAQALHTGTFVWSTGGGMSSTGPNQFLIRAAGGVGIGTSIPGGRALGVNGLGLANEWIGFQVNQSTLWHINNFNNGWNLVETGAADGRLFVAAGGRVGINTIAPEQALHVIGNILASGTITPNSDRNAKTAITSVDSAAILERVAKLPIQQWRFKAEAEGVKHIGPMAQDFQAAFGLGEMATAIATVDADGVALAAIQGLNQKVEAKDARIVELERRLEELERLMNRENGGAR